MLNDPNSLPAWVWSALSSLFGAGVGGGVMWGKYSTRVETVEHNQTALEERVEKRLDLIHADVRSINETLSRRPNCANFSPKE